MELVLQVVLASLAAATAVGVVVIEYYWHDRRTRRFKLVRIALFAGTLVFAALNIVALILDDRADDHAQAELLSRIERESALAADRDAVQGARLADLLDSSRRLEGQLDPFLREALARHPKASSSEDALRLLKEELAAAKKTISEVHLRQSPRQLTTDQSQLFVNALRLQPGHRVIVASVMGDGEGRGFATQLSTLLREAGWMVEDQRQSIYDRDPVGVVLTVRDRGSAPPGLRTLLNALTAAGVDSNAAAHRQVSADVIEVRVGHKPP